MAQNQRWKQRRLEEKRYGASGWTQESSCIFHYQGKQSHPQENKNKSHIRERKKSSYPAFNNNEDRNSFRLKQIQISLKWLSSEIYNYQKWSGFRSITCVNNTKHGSSLKHYMYYLYIYTIKSRPTYFGLQPWHHTSDVSSQQCVDFSQVNYFFSFWFKNLLACG